MQGQIQVEWRSILVRTKTLLLFYFFGQNRTMLFMRWCYQFVWCEVVINQFSTFKLVKSQWMSLPCMGCSYHLVATFLMFNTLSYFSNENLLILIILKSSSIFREILRMEKLHGKGYVTWYIKFLSYILHFFLALFQIIEMDVFIVMVHL